MIIDPTGKPNGLDPGSIEFKKPKDIDLWCDGMIACHNMPCPIYPDDKHAVFHMNTGAYFAPSRKAEAEGWRIVRIKPGRERLYNFLKKFILED